MQSETSQPIAPTDNGVYWYHLGSVLMIREYAMELKKNIIHTKAPAMEYMHIFRTVCLLSVTLLDKLNSD